MRFGRIHPTRVAALLAVLVGASLAGAQSPIQAPKPSAHATLAQTVVDQLLTARIVAVGENHGHLQLHRLLIDTLADPGVAAVVDDLVVEWGNSRFQDLVDRYVAGEAVTIDELAPVWRDTISSPSPVWEAPVYRTFFEEIRRLNRERTDDRAYRIVLGGPPVDWSEVEGPKDLTAFGTLAETMFRVAEELVLRRGRRAILLAGGGHVSYATMVRVRSNGLRVAEVTPLALLRLHYPGSTYAIRSMGRAGAAYEPQSVDARPGSVVPVAGPLAALPANGITRMKNYDGTPFDLYGDQTLGDMVEAILYWGDPGSYQSSDADLCSQLDESWWTELSRRSLLLMGRDLPATWREECGQDGDPD